MISLLAPSKTMDFITPVSAGVASTEARFQASANEIMASLKSLDDETLAKLMKISPNLTNQVRGYLNDWGRVVKPSLWAYKGDVYKGMYSETLTAEDAEWADQHLMIISGLYGLVRPTEEISAYRLEMGAKLAVAGSKNLYDYWSDRLAKMVDEQANGTVCVLSSDEYARAVVRHLKSRTITPVFMDHKPNGKIGPVPIYSKMMRGVMARWIIDHRVDSPEQLAEFTGHGYIYDEQRSTLGAPAFVRKTMKPLVF